MQDEKGRWQGRVAFDKREKKSQILNERGHTEINLLLESWVGKISHSPSKVGDSITFPALLFTLGKGCSLMCNSLFMCCGHCHPVMIWHKRTSTLSSLQPCLKEWRREKRWLTFPLTLKAWVSLCCHGFVSPWPFKCGFPVFIPRAYQEVLKRHATLPWGEGGHGRIGSECTGIHIFHYWGRQKAFLLGLYRGSIKHVLHNTFPIFLPIWKAESEGTLGAVDHLREKRKDSGTVSSLFSSRKRESCCFRVCL